MQTFYYWSDSFLSQLRSEVYIHRQGNMSSQQVPLWQNDCTYIFTGGKMHACNYEINNTDICAFKCGVFQKA